MTRYVPVDHPRFRRAQRDIFSRTMTPDCLHHRCKLITKKGPRARMDACCHYGADVDLAERDRILERQAEIAEFLHPEAADVPWFSEPMDEPDYPSGSYVRTTVWEGHCVFLAHEHRGCAIHRAALAGGWDMLGVKPHVCQLYPLSYETDAIVLSEDYPWYSCAHEPAAPSVYRVCRSAAGAIFGQDLVAALDRAEAQVLGTKLPVMRGPAE